mgnify:CR=1 FL=1
MTHTVVAVMTSRMMPDGRGRWRDEDPASAEVDALLRKRRVSVAVGWIGLAWLSPIFGTALYLTFGINRVSRRARRLRTKPSDATQLPDTDDAVVPEALWPLDRAIRRITGLPAFAVPAAAYRMSASPARITRRPPRMGQHTDEVLREHGYTQEDIGRLRAAGII